MITSPIRKGGLHGTPQLGKYQLIRRLATGGMAELFLARSRAMHGFEKLVVLKRILPQHAESDEFIQMFLTEARLAATLHHPNIVQVYDIGEEDGAHFFTMEYVQGQDLRKIVRAARKAHRAIPLEHILHIIIGIAAGLHHAHTKMGMDGEPLGIVHRDVSPSNVLVTYEGGVKIVDFGIAKAATAQVATVAGTLKGKIPYMSPEQCRGEIVDRRSDVFSIGTLLWELTTGKRLFSGENEFAILGRVAKADVPMPSSIRPDYPPELEAIVMKALQADRDQRYSSAVDLQVDLEDFAREAQLPVSSPRVARFMQELFDKEMRQAAMELKVEEGQSSSNPSIPGSIGQSKPKLVDGSGDPIIAHGESALPATGQFEVEADSTDTDTTEFEDDDDMLRAAGMRRWAPVLSIGGGVLVLGAFVTAFAMSRSEPSDTAATESLPPIEVVPSEVDPGWGGSLSSSAVAEHELKAVEPRPPPEDNAVDVVKDEPLQIEGLKPAPSDEETQVQHETPKPSVSKDSKPRSKSRSSSKPRRTSTKDRRSSKSTPKQATTQKSKEKKPKEKKPEVNPNALFPDG